MTRHGMAKTPAAGFTPPATDPHGPVDITGVDMLPTRGAPGCQSRADAPRSDLSVAIEQLPGCRITTPRISRKAKSP
ncbi:hypothetical protein FVA81_19725 [Rhizobium sp. WL3]|nr:hypothetical protein FVA81_19725 [Rhizobium sp. WL3]